MTWAELLSAEVSSYLVQLCIDLNGDARCIEADHVLSRLARALQMLSRL